jgi:hypothetical protein
MDLLKKVLQAKRESRQIEFKQSFDPDSKRDWLEKMVRSIVAIANSGGGIIIFGLDKGGNTTVNDIKPVLSIDQATITDKINTYTQTQFADFEVRSVEKEGTILAAILVRAVSVPMVFTKEGAYHIPGEKKPGIAFARGTVYFRHGAKSEPGNSDDLRDVIERQLQVVRKEWFDGVRMIADAPMGSQIKVLPPEVQQSDDPGAMPVRITNDPSAPTVYRETIIINPNQTHTFRRNEVVLRLREHLPANLVFNFCDVYAIRKVYGVDENSEFYFKPKFGSAQYSDVFIKWILSRYKEDNEFFAKTRAQLKKK